jgi:hypothetical protein
MGVQYPRQRFRQINFANGVWSFRLLFLPAPNAPAYVQDSAIRRKVSRFQR